MPSVATAEPLILDSVTHLKPEHRGRVAHCASHGGTYAGYYAAGRGIGGLILNDAGIGRGRAGLAGVELLEMLGVPAAAVSHRTARIGDGRHGAARGRLSFVNEIAEGFGLEIGMGCAEALARLGQRALAPAPAPPRMEETRFEVESGVANVRAVVMDSISLVVPADAGRIVVAASHGGLLGGDPSSAVKYDAYAVVTNDADRGIDDAGTSRLPALDARGIAGACVSAFSSRIGEGRSQWQDGYISAINMVAKSRGGAIGQSTAEFVAAMADAMVSRRTASP